METKPKTPTPPQAPVTRNTVDSRELLQGGDVVEITHGTQRYQLRVTRENKLILTK